MLLIHWQLLLPLCVFVFGGGGVPCFVIKCFVSFDILQSSSRANKLVTLLQVYSFCHIQWRIQRGT